MRKRHATLVSFFLFVSVACGTRMVSSPTASLHSEVRTDSLVFHADAVVLHPSEIVRARVTVTNTSPHASTIFVAGGCPVIFQLLSSVSPNDRTVWDSRKARSSMGCAASMLRARIEPGESRVFVRGVELAEIMGDSLRAGRYFVSSQLDLWPGPALKLSAGELVLSK